MPSTNRIASAFKEPFNTLGLAAAVAVSAAIVTPIPLLVGLVAEAAYLLFVPDSKWYEARLSKRFDAEVEARRAKLKAKVLPTLRPDMQERFTRLEAARTAIGGQDFEDAHWFREVLRKLDYLLEKFLLFAAKEVEYRSYLRQVHDDLMQESGRGTPVGFQVRDMRASRSVGRGANPGPPPIQTDGVTGDVSDAWTNRMVTDLEGYYDSELGELTQSIGSEQDENTKAVLQKRSDVLTRRREFVGKMGKILTNLNHQLQLVQDTFGLISDEIRARSPEQILADIEDVVYQTDSMTSLLEELAPYEQMSQRLSV